MSLLNLQVNLMLALLDEMHWSVLYSSKGTIQVVLLAFEVHDTQFYF